MVRDWIIQVIYQVGRVQPDSNWEIIYFRIVVHSASKSQRHQAFKVS